jgi:hypothetical protein
LYYQYYHVHRRTNNFRIELFGSNDYYRRFLFFLKSLFNNAMLAQGCAPFRFVFNVEEHCSCFNQSLMLNFVFVYEVVWKCIPCLELSKDFLIDVKRPKVQRQCTSPARMVNFRWHGFFWLPPLLKKKLWNTLGLDSTVANHDTAIKIGVQTHHCLLYKDW